MSPGLEVLCPACGALVSAEDDARLLRLAVAHTIAAHGYSVPPEHVQRAAYTVDETEGGPPERVDGGGVHRKRQESADRPINSPLGGAGMDTQFEDVVKNWEELDWRELDDSPGLKVCAMPVDRDSEATAVAMDYAPGFTIPNHHHTVDHIEVVVRGEITVSGRKETAGAFRFVPRGVIYGPLVAGPEGARVIEFFPDRELESVQGRFTDPAVSAHKNSAERNRDLAAKLGLNF